MLVHSDKEQKLNLWKRLINSKEGTMESGLLNLKLMWEELIQITNLYKVSYDFQNTFPNPIKG